MKLSKLLILSILCIFISACSNDGDDENTPPEPTNNKLLTKVVGIDKNVKIVYTSRLISSVDRLLICETTLYSDKVGIHSFSYNNDIITIGDRHYLGVDQECELNEKKQIVSYGTIDFPSDYRQKYYYNEDGELIRAEKLNFHLKKTHIAKFYWEDGNLVKIHDVGSVFGSMNTLTEIKYTSKEDKLGLNVLEKPFSIGVGAAHDANYTHIEPLNIFYQLGYYGKKSKNLISEINITEEVIYQNKVNHYNVSYTYEFDKDGYVTEIKATGKLFWNDLPHFKLYYDGKE